MAKHDVGGSGGGTIGDGIRCGCIVRLQRREKIDHVGPAARFVTWFQPLLHARWTHGALPVCAQAQAPSPTVPQAASSRRDVT